MSDPDNPPWQEWDGEDEYVLGWCYGTVTITENSVLSALRFVRLLGFTPRLVELYHVSVVFPDEDDVPAVCDSSHRLMGLEEYKATLIYPL